jgi:hypothetical protein
VPGLEVLERHIGQRLCRMGQESERIALVRLGRVRGSTVKPTSDDRAIRCPDSCKLLGNNGFST